MGFFSKSCEYAIRACVYLAQSSNVSERKVLNDISKAIDSPEAFTAKILQSLVKNNLIQSIKGPYGGFFMTEEQIQTKTLFEIVIAIDGADLFTKCALGLKACSSEKPCPMHHQFLEVRERLILILKETTLLKLASSAEIDLTFLK